MIPDTTNADDIFYMAEKRVGTKLEKIRWYDRFTTSTRDFEDGSALYIRAGNLYKAHSQLERAEDAFIKSARCMIRLNNPYEIATSLVLAANVIRNINPIKSAEYYCSAVEYILVNGNFYTAIKWLIIAGDIYLEISDNENALKSFQRALELSSVDNHTTDIDNCSIKIADILVNMKKYSDACNIYENIAKSFNEQLIKRYKAGYFFFMACLCFACTDDLIGFQNKVIDYSSILTTSSRDIYFKFLEQIIVAWQNYDVDEFTRITFEFDEITKLTSLQVSLLLKIKEYGYENETFS